MDAAATATSLYIHFPFCSRFCDYCDYCDFYSVKADDRIDFFLSSVFKDIKYQLELFDAGKIITAYIGGGTPSVAGGRIRYLLDALKTLPGFSPLEFTVEANPESADEEFLSACREGGVTRISIGVQTFHEPSRNAVNRARTGMMEERLALVSQFFPLAFSADLMTGLPLQSEDAVLSDVERTLAYKPAHVSLYSLSVEAGTPLEEKIKRRDVILPDRDKADALWLSGRKALKDAGYEHYEVSNFALPGKKCLHNLRYWRMEGWLGAGPAASGTVIDEKNATAKRYTYPSDLDWYLNSFRDSETPPLCEELDRGALLRESLLMGFRCREGPDTEIFRRRFGCSPEECIPETIARWRNKDIMLFLNTFLSQAFAELDRRGL
ncbi:MAG: coproporphyrinogen III oxidase family protein [Treponema sp.]|nr:coproporphyrinogen III oxidase family protein [Treponema sp.]